MKTKVLSISSTTDDIHVSRSYGSYACCNFARVIQKTHEIIIFFK